MKIKEIKYTDKAEEWNYNKVSFKNLTLLVGASGVGKSQILKSIMTLKEIVDGESENGIKWDITIETLDKSQYNWKGEFEKSEDQYELALTEDEKDKPNIVFEKLYLNGEEIINRFNDTIIFKGNKTVKLSTQQSAINLLKEEEIITPLYKSFSKIVYNDQTKSPRTLLGFKRIDYQNVLKKHKTIDSIQESDLDTKTKLYLAYKNCPQEFEKIKERFSLIFPQIQDLKVEPIEFKKSNVPIFLTEIPFIQIKEQGVTKWILEQNISSGMFRSLIHICEIHLCSKGSIFLIDEFENSLGVNCISEITHDIINTDRNLQFIITSHHPYIINNIDSSFWKLVTRNKSTVLTKSVQELGIGKSKHDAFMQLMQLEEFQTGISG